MQTKQIDQANVQQLSTNALIAKPDFKIVTITPQIAEEIIQNRNGLNRKVKKNQIHYMADLMINGSFNPYNGETLKFAGSFETGMLIDGQHRLMAIIESQSTYDFPVALNIDESLFTTIDRGIPRSNGDIFEIEKVPNSRNIASMIGTYVKLRYRTADDAKSKSIDNPLTKFKTGPEELLDIYRNHKELINDIYYDTYKKYLTLSLLGPSKLAGLIMWTVLHSQYADRCINEFWNPLMTGDNLEKYPNVKVCRNLLISAQIRKKDKSDSYNTYVAWIIKSYNNHFAGKPVNEGSLKKIGKNSKSLSLK